MFCKYFQKHRKYKYLVYLCFPSVPVVVPFFMGVMFLDVCDAGGLPPEGVVEVGLDAALLAEVLGAAGLAVAVALLVVLLVGGLVEPVVGRDVAVGPVEGLKKHDRQKAENDSSDITKSRAQFHPTPGNMSGGDKPLQAEYKILGKNTSLLRQIYLLFICIWASRVHI